MQWVDLYLQQSVVRISKSHIAGNVAVNRSGNVEGIFYLIILFNKKVNNCTVSVLITEVMK